MRNTSSPRTFSSIFTNVSPSGNGLTVDLPSSMPMKAQMASARGWLEVPLKIFTMRVLFQKITQGRTIIFTPALPSGESGLDTTKKTRRTGGEKSRTDCNIQRRRCKRIQEMAMRPDLTTRAIQPQPVIRVESGCGACQAGTRDDSLET